MGIHLPLHLSCADYRVRGQSEWEQVEFKQGVPLMPSALYFKDGKFEVGDHALQAFQDDRGGVLVRYMKHFMGLPYNDEMEQQAAEFGFHLRRSTAEEWGTAELPVCDLGPGGEHHGLACPAPSCPDGGSNTLHQGYAHPLPFPSSCCFLQ